MRISDWSSDVCSSDLQALLEGCVYDPGSGQLLTGSFLDYAMPRADDLPALTIRRQEVPCTTNHLGVKGCGEAGAIGAPPAVINAILDALASLGVRDIAMHATPPVVWRAIVEARRRTDRTSVVAGKGWVFRVDPGGGR